MVLSAFDLPGSEAGLKQNSYTVTKKNMWLCLIELATKRFNGKNFGFQKWAYMLKGIFHMMSFQAKLEGCILNLALNLTI